MIPRALPFAALVLAAFVLAACTGGPPGANTTDAPPAASGVESAEAPAPVDEPAPEPAEPAAAEREASADEAEGDDPRTAAMRTVERYLRESVDDGPPPPSMDGWDFTAFHTTETAAFLLGSPATPEDAQAFADFCGGIASALGPDDAPGYVAAYVRGGTAGGWTVLDANVCADEGTWTTWPEEYAFPPQWPGIAVQ